METNDARLVQSNEGASDAITSETICPPGCECDHFHAPEDQTVEGNQGQEGTPSEQPSAESGQVQPPPGYENTPPELWPDEHGNPPKLTAELIRRLRGKYFTVRHPKLVECGHRLDMINEPRHRNCENCWWTFFNTHPQLVEVADQMYRTQGKKAVEGLRGKTFVTMFQRYMATVIHFMKQEGRLPNESGTQESTSASREESISIGSGIVAQ